MTIERGFFGVRSYFGTNQSATISLIPLSGDKLKAPDLDEVVATAGNELALGGGRGRL